MRDLPELLAIARVAAQRGADIIRTSTPVDLTPKGDRDYASDVDYTVEHVLRDMLQEATPEIAFLGEEESLHAELDGGPYWVLDPIDGTVNFTNGIPLCAISLALIQDEVPIVGVIQLPYLDHTYSAAQGYGATRDGKLISVGRPASLSEAIVSIGDYAVGDDAGTKNRDRIAITQALANAALRVRMLGSAAIDLALVAQGSTGATIMLGNKPWDTAAGVIVAREAGANVTDIDGSRHTTRSAATVATAVTITDSLLILIRDALTHSQTCSKCP